MNKVAKGILGALGIVGASALALLVKAAGKDGFEDFLMTASDEELADAYETRRLQWLKDGQGGTGEKTPEMKRLDREMSRRSAEKWKKDPRRSKDPTFRWTDANRWDRD